VSSIVQPESDDKPAKRKPISKRVRFEVLKRDNYTCRYCRSTEQELTVDHVVPVALGGSSDPNNLVAACKDCNAGKTSTSPNAATVAQVSEDAVRWAAAMELAAQMAAEKAQRVHEYVSAFEAAWLDWGFGPERTVVPRPADWEASVKHWHTAGLPIALLIDAVRVAMTNDNIDASNTWRYFCGVAWGKIRDLQDAARALL
jgi:hypothetical protein